VSQEGFSKEENINTWLHQINEGAKSAVSVDCVIFGYDEGDLKLLSIDCNMPPYVGKKSLVGDLVDANENLDEAANRVLSERAGIEGLYLEQVKTFGSPNRHPLGRVFSIAYYTIVPIADHMLKKVLDRNPQWVAINSINEMAFDHALILESCLATLRRRIHTYPLAFNILPNKFTVVQLQTVYEKVLNKKLDKRNFRRKLKKLPYIIDREEMQSDVNHRPARLYSFNFEKYQRHLQKDKVNFNL
jgi:8-oxo-dGTP diphosphatase